MKYVILICFGISVALFVLGLRNGTPFGDLFQLYIFIIGPAMLGFIGFCWLVSFFIKVDRKLDDK